MTSLGNKQVFSENLRYYIEKSGKTQKEVSVFVGIAYSTFNDWCTGKKYPRIDKIEMLSNYFGIKKSDLIEERLSDAIKKDNDILTDIIIRMRSDKKFFATVEALWADKEFLDAVSSLRSLDAEKQDSIKAMLRTLAK